MSAVPDRRDHLPGLTLHAILAHDKRYLPQPTPRPPPETSSGRTLLDIIRDEDPANRTGDPKDRRSWKIFRDRLRLKRAGAAWTSSVRIPASDIPIQSNNADLGSQLSRRSSARIQTNPSNNLGESTQSEDQVIASGPTFTRRTSTRLAATPISTESTQNDGTPDVSMPSELPPSRSFRPQMSHRNSTRVSSSNPDSDEPYVDPFEVGREGTRRLAAALAEERALSAREAVVAQEAAQAEAAAGEDAEETPAAETPTATDVAPEVAAEEPQPQRISLMDLLEETDRETGLEGSRYLGEDKEEEEEEGDMQEIAGGIEYNCCVCMVRHKGSAFIPCGHTFCRLCSRELWVQRGNCPLCNGFILEILDIF